MASLFLCQCARSPIRDSTEALRIAKKPIAKTDDLKLAGLKEALKANVARFKELNNSTASLQFGQKQLATTDYVLALEYLIKILDKEVDEQIFFNFVNDNFESYEVYGSEEWGDVFITSYYEPTLLASTKPTDIFTQPLYYQPQDMVLIRMDRFAERFPHWSAFQNMITEQKSETAVLRGRLIPAAQAQEGFSIVEPYFNRQEIDELGSLKNKSLEIVYVDPVDAFFLHIQGSGLIQLPKTSFRVGYAAQNGYPYVPIGKLLLDKIPKEKMSLQKIEAHLRSLPKVEMQRLMNENPSYVFFRKLKNGAVTSFGVDVVDGRTIATDRTFFPKGAIAVLEFEKPVFNSEADEEPAAFEKVIRLVLDQDTGGAIRGPGRVDLFAGRGVAAKQMAGVMKSHGRLNYLIPKETFIEKIKTESNLIPVRSAGAQ